MEEILLKPISFEAFTWFRPTPKNPFAITIPNQDDIRINSKLLPKLPSYIEIGIGEGGGQIGLRACEDGYKVTKDGNIRATEVIMRLREAGVRLPARYTVEETDGGFLGTLVKTPEVKLDVQKTPCTPKKKELSGLVKEIAAK